MKVLWFSNSVLSGTVCSGSGSWLFGMKSILSGRVELYNITSSSVTEITKRISADITEYLLPEFVLKEGIPNKESITKIQSIIKEVSPDIIHIWGMEKYWARLYQRGFIYGCPVLLELQGVPSSICNAFYGGMSPKEVLKTYGLREVVRPWARLDIQLKRNLERAKDESVVLNSFTYISTQSSWTRNQIRFNINDNCKVFETLRPIRPEFYHSRKWEKRKTEAPTVYTSLSYCSPLKGLHVLIKAMGLVVKQYPTASLVIAGFDSNKPFYKVNGYERYLKRLIKEQGIHNNVSFPGRLDANAIVHFLLNADIFVNPSFVESYSAAAAEALYLGVPSILSFAGALPCFSETKQLALYYSPMDYVDCASKIIELFKNENMSSFLSSNSITFLSQLCSQEKVLEKQLSIYKTIAPIKR